MVSLCWPGPLHNLDMEMEVSQASHFTLHAILNYLTDIPFLKANIPVWMGSGTSFVLMRQS